MLAHFDDDPLCVVVFEDLLPDFRDVGHGGLSLVLMIKSSN